MAGALFENFCVQETLKTLLFQGYQPKLYYLRSYNNLEVDLLIEGKNLKLHPCEVKMTKTPKPQMADPIHRFKALFPKLPVGEGRILCLAENDLQLTREAKVQPLSSYWSWMKANL